jgi:hypothetical protein
LISAPATQVVHFCSAAERRLIRFPRAQFCHRTIAKDSTNYHDLRDDDHFSLPQNVIYAGLDFAQLGASRGESK